MSLALPSSRVSLALPGRGINEEVNLRSPLILKRVDTNEAPGGKLNSREYEP